MSTDTKEQAALSELIALLKQVDRMVFRGARWLRWDRWKAEWEVRKDDNYLGSNLIAHSPDLLLALKALLYEEAK